MLGKFTGEDQADRGLDLARGDGGLLVVGGELGGLSCDALEDVWVDCQYWTRLLDAIEICLPLTKELRMDMARLEIPVSGWTCLRTGKDPSVMTQMS